MFKKIPFEDRYDPSADVRAPVTMRAPLCIRCKRRAAAHKAHRVQEAILALQEAFDTESASRIQTERFFERHRALVRASKGRYCESCIESAIEFAKEFIERNSKCEEL